MTVWETAKSSGELVYRFRQSESPVLTQPGPWGRTLPSRIATDGDNARYNGYLRRAWRPIGPACACLTWISSTTNRPRGWTASPIGVRPRSRACTATAPG